MKPRLNYAKVAPAVRAASGPGACRAGPRAECAAPAKGASGARRLAPSAQLLAVTAQQVVGCDERIRVLGQRRRQDLPGAPIGGAVVLSVGDEAEALQHTKAVGVQGKQACPFGKHQDLVRTGLPNHGKLRQCLARRRNWQPQRSAEISVPSSDCELGGMAQPGGSNSDSNRPAEAGNVT